MFFRTLTTLAGFVGTLFPELVVETARDATLGGFYENPGDLRPKEWCVRATRLQSALVAVAGLLAIGLGRQREGETGGAEAAERSD
jgi:hypothetical protein